jgi:pimeloyl-ACP methyl ester carboxylesterase
VAATASAANPGSLGKYDPSFQVAEVAAYQRDLPNAEVHILDAGHFALYERPDDIADLMKDFLGRTLNTASTPK